MTDQSLTTRQKVERSIKRRRRAEMRFRTYGVLAISFGLLCLLTLFGNILANGASAFKQTVIEVSLPLDGEYLGLNRNSSEEAFLKANYEGLIKKALKKQFKPKGRKQRRQLYQLVSSGGHWQLQEYLMSHPEQLNQTVKIALIADDDVDQWFKHDRDKGVVGRLTDTQVQWLEQWIDDGALYTRFNTTFFTNGDSREPELAGIRGAITGTFLTLLVTFLLSFPIGVAAAIYLEEFAPNNRMTELVEININNLAAVPSITFGLLGLAIFINVFGVARSTPLVGGLVLTLMTLPTIIISGRAAIKAVPPSIREAALGLGASRVQVVFHHVLPLALPGMLTGTIIGMAQALGETAPLLMIGMIAFVVDIPSFVTDPSTVLPVQIFLWSDSPERAFTERTSGAILVLLTFLISMNAVAIWLRRRLERRW
tara:strand:+ start:1304 stop:2581 length:1278 start_codon:yes stop_codon:yes gene_type:complete